MRNEDLPQIAAWYSCWYAAASRPSAQDRGFFPIEKYLCWNMEYVVTPKEIEKLCVTIFVAFFWFISSDNCYMLFLHHH